MLVAGALAMSMGGSPVWAATATGTATVTTTVPIRANLALKRDPTGSVTRGTVSTLLFDKYDDQDTGVTAPSANFMYAPYRSETGKNWHMAEILANGASMTLSIDVTGTVGTLSLSSILFVFCGGFFPAVTGTGTSTAIAGSASTDWQLADTYTKTLTQTFNGVVPFNYRLTVTGVRAAAYTGTVTFTLVST
jgi:hypothetical protein